MKPFDLQAAKNGAELVTREGKPARILCYDFLRYKYETGSSYREILTAITDQDEKGTKFEMFVFHDTSGKATMVIPDNEEEKYDLFIKGKKRYGYVAIFKELDLRKENRIHTNTIVYETISKASKFNSRFENFIAVAKIEWEE